MSGARVFDPRANTEQMVQQENLQGLLEHAAEIHGHVCPGVAAGVKAAATAMRRLDLQSEGMEDVMAEVECNNCFVDGIQAVSGCTLGNNALIYRDLGKTAVTFYRRGDSTGLRLCVRHMGPGVGLDDDEAEEADRLFEKAVKERKELDEAESRRFRKLWHSAAGGILDMPDEEFFAIETVEVSPPTFAPIFDSAECSVCGEEVMETRARLQGGEPVCLSCSGEHHWLVHGAGIMPSATEE